MRVLVYPAMMEIGGSQLNALELAEGVKQRGHSVTLFAPQGALVPKALRMGLDYVQAPVEDAFPSARNVVKLCDLVRTQRIDILHAYEWGPSLELAFGPHLLLGTPLVTTVMSMSVSAEVPRHAHLILGTQELVDQERHKGRTRATLMEPPIDTDINAPGTSRSDATATAYAADDMVIAIVGRLTDALDKLAGVLTAIDVVGTLARSDKRIHLWVVGDGPGYAEAAEAADRVNTSLGRVVIRVDGQLLDPRPAYDRADIVLGMGSSAIKGMAFAKPVVVQGNAGFWRLLEESSLPMFFGQGWYGDGGRGADDLRDQLLKLLDNREYRRELGQLGRGIAVDRYALRNAIDQQINIYRQALQLGTPAHQKAGSLAHSAIELAKFRIVQRRRELARFVPGPRLALQNGTP